MQFRPLGRSGLSIAPLVLGGNVFGATVDAEHAPAVLDALLDHGLNAIDTADIYSRGVSETMIGDWMQARRNRDKVVLFTKVGMDMGTGKGLSARWIAEEVEASLKRLKTDYIDLYQSHAPDPTVGQEETLEAYQRLIKAGKVRAIGASNYDDAQLAEAMRLHAEKGLPRYESLQNEYNLYTRDRFEGPTQQFTLREGIGNIPFFGLASGFLTGKYRGKDDLGQSKKGPRTERYLNDKGFRILAALDAVAARTGATQAEIALAWILAQPGITAPIASASRPEQVASLRRAVDLVLSPEDLAELTAAGR